MDDTRLTPPSEPHHPPRPGDFARILLAASGGPPRLRARDQQSDLAGEALRRVVLSRLAALDPDPADLLRALGEIIAALPPPSGPARGVCTAILQEWSQARDHPAYWSFLVRRALEAESDSHRRVRLDPGAAPSCSGPTA